MISRIYTRLCGKSSNVYWWTWLPLEARLSTSRSRSTSTCLMPTPVSWLPYTSTRGSLDWRLVCITSDPELLRMRSSLPSTRRRLRKRWSRRTSWSRPTAGRNQPPSRRRRKFRRWMKRNRKRTWQPSSSARSRTRTSAWCVDLNQQEQQQVKSDALFRRGQKSTTRKGERERERAWKVYFGV